MAIFNSYVTNYQRVPNFFWGSWELVGDCTTLYVFGGYANSFDTKTGLYKLPSGNL